MSDAVNYGRWTKDSLVKRITFLEQQMKKQQKQAASAATTALPAAAVTAQAEEEPQQEQSLKKGDGKKPSKKKSTTTDPSRYTTRFIVLKLAYLGRNYNGFEYQQDGREPTVEEELWKALVKTCLISPERPEEVNFNNYEYSKCGRTDQGVSAFGQVVALRVRSNRPVPGSRKPKPDGDGAAAATAAGESGMADATVAGAEAEAAGPSGEQPEQEGQREADIIDDDDGSPYPVEKELQYCKLLNRVLPRDIRILAWCPTPPPEFSARFSCRERQYRYFFTQPAFAPMPSVLEPDVGGGTAGTGPKVGYLDIEAMRTAARHFEGTNDFRNFCKIDSAKQISNFKRLVLEADIVEVPAFGSALPYLDGPQFRAPSPDTADGSTPDAVAGGAPKIYYFHVRATAFLWHQIRHMVAVLFLVGQGLEKPSVVAELLDTARYPGRPNYALAAAPPLVLWDCVFGRKPPPPPPDSAAAAVAIDGNNNDVGLGGEEKAAAAEEEEEEEQMGPDLDWVYAGEGGDSSDLHGARGLVDTMWETWRERKMDELLANRLLDRVTALTDPARAAAADPLMRQWQEQERQQQQQQKQQQEDEEVGDDDSGSSNSGGEKAARKTKPKPARKPAKKRKVPHKVFDGRDGPRIVGQYVPLAKRPTLDPPEETNEKWARSKGFASVAEMRASGNWISVIRARKAAAKAAAAAAAEGEEQGGADVA